MAFGRRTYANRHQAVAETGDLGRREGQVGGAAAVGPSRRHQHLAADRLCSD